MSLDNLLLVLVLAFIAWRLVSSFRVRRRVPGLRREGAQRNGEAASCSASGSSTS